MEQKTVKQDINFLEYPLWQIGKKDSTQIFRWTDRNGYGYEARKGTPNKVDILFLYFFMHESQKNNWDNEIVLSRHEILKSCGITSSQANYNRLEESLEKWKFTGLRFSGTFYDGEDYETISFCVLNDWRLRKRDKKLSIEFNRHWMLKIKNSAFFKFIDFEQIKKLKSPLALRLFEILDKNFYGRNIWEIGILKLGAKIPMPEKYVSDIAPKIQAATRKIKDKTSLDISVETVKQGRGKGKFIFTKVKAKQTALPEQKSPPKTKQTKTKAKPKQKNLTTIQQNLQRQKKQMQEQNKIQRKKQTLEKKINKLSKKNLQKLDNYIAVQDLNSMQQRFFDLKKMDSLRLHYYSECFSVKAVNEITYDL